jgi:hypothetical protein
VADTPSKVVIRTYAPARGWIVGISLTLAAAIGGYALFEYGRSRAGFDQLESLRARAALRREIRSRDDLIRDLRRESAELATLRSAQTEERAELSRTIGQLQAEVAKQSQQLAFYQGIVVQGANAAEVKIQQLRVGPGSAERSFVVRLTLVQSGRPDRAVSGKALLSVEGQRGGVPATLKLEEVTGARTAELPFSFRYFENLDPEIVIPDDFRPERIIVEIRSSRREVAPIVQTYVWQIESA